MAIASPVSRTFLRVVERWLTRPMSDLLALGDVHFILLTTYRKNGEGVGTPVWVARDGDSLVVFTPSGTAKLKRLRHTSRVEVVECGRRGKVADGAVPVQATASIETDQGSVENVAALLKAKYGLEFRLFMAVESVASFVRRKPKAPRVAIRITAA